MWNNLSLHVPIWIGIFVIGFKLGGGNFESPPEPQPQEITQEDLEWQRCGQYGLIYWEADNGFYNCKKDLEWLESQKQ